MKYLKLVSVFFFLVSSALAQDTIILINQNKILAKVIEVNSLAVKYKKSGNTSEPDYSELKKNIQLIKYASGFVDSVQKQAAPILASLPTSYDRIEKINGRYYFVDANHVKLFNSTVGINRILIKANYMRRLKANKELELLIAKTKKRRVMQVSFGIAGLPLMIVGAGIGLVSYAVYSNSEDSSQKSSSLNTAYLGVGLASVGVGCEIFSLVNGSMKRKRLRETIYKYNDLAK